MKVLVVGGGGREHTIGWSLSQSDQVNEVIFAPGNGGTIGIGRNVDIGANDISALVELAIDEGVGLVVVGPEDPLVGGLVDEMMAAGVPAFGPTAMTAQLEGSKAYAKQFMQDNGIPTGAAAAFTVVDGALEYLSSLDAVPVIKADGLAAGKGVLIPETMEEAAAGIRAILIDRRFGDACDRVLIEERLVGVEASVLAFCDGSSIAVMPVAQDHKRLGDGDAGPNTGGMGAFVPSPVITDELLEQIEAEVLQPVLSGMAAAGTPYVGVIYAGIMVTADGPRVLEFNCRFGDPETQVVLPLLETDLVDIFQACIEGHLADVTPAWSSEAAATVVLASGGYPEIYPTGFEIAGIADAEAAGGVVFHAGTTTDGETLITSGGRVLAVTATGATLVDAVGSAYAAAEHVQFEGAVLRTDIGRPLDSSGSSGGPDPSGTSPNGTVTS